ncbi:hypothetical protein GQ44DRAFT_622613 [Phaeosphaeriaceae sp. PMI808]|nr:hypothetical protein GQ44DRAFT_622613 [Phaeosphaeriaceae sp. PMI808]
MEKVKTKIATHKRKREIDSSDSESEVAEVADVQTKQKWRHGPKIEDSEDDNLRLPRGKQPKTRKRQPTAKEDDEVEDATPPRSRRHISSMRQHAPATHHLPSLPRSKRRRITKQCDKSTDDDEEGKNEFEWGNESAPDGNNDERNDLEEDLAFLKSSPLPKRGKLGSSQEKSKNERQKALEALKKRRAITNEPSSSATPGRKRRFVVEDSDSELEIIKEESENGWEMDFSEEVEEEETGRDANALDMFQEDNDDAGFIDDDVDAVIGEPILEPEDLMPLVMSRIVSAKPRELFKYAIEWMVMKKVHPAFDSKSQVYELTFRKLDDEVKGLANSKFSSSAWTSDFTRALRARPDLMSMEISRGKRELMTAHCEACNRKNHPASNELTFTGKPYSVETLEPMENVLGSDSDSTDSSALSVSTEAGLDGEMPTYDIYGARLPPESKSFTLGRTCQANAQIAHTLHHWRYHLYSWVKDYLARKGYLTAERLVKRDGWSEKKREKAAIKILKAMEKDGEIRKLYKAYKDQIKYAVEVRHDLQGWRSRGE